MPDVSIPGGRPPRFEIANPLELACVNALTPNTPGYTFVRTFQHVDWVDFESLVQAGKTPEEAGLNDRLHRIEADLDMLGDNIRRAFIAIETMRAQVSICLNEIVTILNAKEKDSKEKEEAKDTKDNTDSKSSKDTKDNKDSKDNKENKEAKEGKDTKDNKENKEDKDGVDKDKERGKETLGAAEKKDDDGRPRFRDIDGVPFEPMPPDVWPDFVPPGEAQRVFITPDERPRLGERALSEPRAE